MAEKKHKFHTTTVKHHKDGSHTTTHHHEDGDHMNVEYATGDHDGMMDGMMHHTSEPDEEEMAADKGEHGIPDQIAEKAMIAGPRPTGA